MTIKYEVVITPKANDDIQEIFDWYYLKNEWLSDYFIDKLTVILSKLEYYPNRFRKVNNEVRKAKLEKFPYIIYFYIEHNQVIVLCVIHGKRHPDAWKK
jgi:plasmid stabilization system protein ParE